jgi:hypothetical protein
MRIAAFCLATLALIIPAGTACGGLITNGNFESGNTGFTTQYTYTTDLTAPRTIVVGINPHNYNPFAASYCDHTSRQGRMLIANGATTDDVTIWQQTVSVAPNTHYVFCYWLSNWTDNDIRLAEIRCTINGLYAGTGWAPAATGEWVFVFCRWDSGSNTQATIRLVDVNRADVSNDFAIDDIDLFDIGSNYLLVTYSTKGGSVLFPGEGVFIYPPDEHVQLQASCQSGYEFAGWGGNIFDKNHTTGVDMTGDCVAIAQFKKLDYSVTMQGSGSAPNEFSTCEESVDRLAMFQGALDASAYPGGLVVGQRKGVCVATYLFPILKSAADRQDISKVAVNVYGGVLSATTWTVVGDSGLYTPMYAADVHQTFTGKAIMGLLRPSEGPVYWLPVAITGSAGAFDLQDVYVSYDCASVPRLMLRRFHDHLSLYEALQAYARNQDIRDLFDRRANSKNAWEAIVQTSGLAEDLAGYSETLQGVLGLDIEGLDDLLAELQSLADSPDPTMLPRCNSEAIVPCLDAAVSSGESYITVYADAIADGRVDEQEASQINRAVGQFSADMIALNGAMSQAYRALGEVHRTATSSRLADTAEKMMRAMAPWLTGEPDEWGFWILANPTYLDQVTRDLREFPVEDITGARE